MEKKSVTYRSIKDFSLWDKTEAKRTPLKMDLELTDRCNNNCRHCYSNLPEHSENALEKELSFDRIKGVIDQAASMGTLWCLITGGEPLLRTDFIDIYTYLKRKGFLITVFTNATLITQEHIRLFKEYPPRNLEVTVYGISKKTYEQVTRTPGSYDRFRKGLDLLKSNSIPVGLKTVAIRSNYHELQDIFKFCKRHTDTDFRFDPFINLRHDLNTKKNIEISNERLTPDEIHELEKKDSKRHQALKKACEKLSIDLPNKDRRERLLDCFAGINSFTVSSTGYFKLCSSLTHPDFMFQLNEHSLSDVWYNFVPDLLNATSNCKEYLEKCAVCSLIDLCMWCPAVAYLEKGRLDVPVDLFCAIANKRKEPI